MSDTNNMAERLAKMPAEVTEAEISNVLRRLNVHGTDLALDAAKCIYWLRAGIVAAETDNDVKRDALSAVTEGRGLADDDLWARMKNERDEARALVARLRELPNVFRSCRNFADDKRGKESDVYNNGYWHGKGNGFDEATDLLTAALSPAAPSAQAKPTGEDKQG